MVFCASVPSTLIKPIVGLIDCFRTESHRLRGKTAPRIVHHISSYLGVEDRGRTDG
jgi:hypothetical protein